MITFNRARPIFKTNFSKVLRVNRNAFEKMLVVPPRSQLNLSSTISFTKTNFTSALIEIEKNGLDEDLIIEELKESDLPEIKELMKLYYYPREPMSVMQNVTYEDHKEVLEDSLQEFLEKKVSVVARDKNTKKIVGCYLATILSEDKDGDSNKISSNNKSYSIKARNDLKLVEILKKKVDLFKKYNVDKILQAELGTVNPSYSGRKLNLFMISESWKRGKELGCQLTSCQSTNIITQNICQKLGYEMEAEMDYASMRIDGKRVLDLGRNTNAASTAQTYSRWL